jgi:chromosome segregation ATPase
MRSIPYNALRPHAAVLLALALVLPVLNGCSTLGIATTDDITAMEARLQSANSATDTRVNTLEQNTADMQQTLNEITASLDTLNARFARAKTWIETMNIDTISADVQEASQKAMSAEARSRAFLEHYLEWIKSQQALFEQQIVTLEAKLKQAEETKPLDEPDTAPAEQPEETGGDQGG